MKTVFALLFVFVTQSAQASPFDELKARADAYRSSGQEARDQAAAYDAAWKRRIPGYNRAVLKSVRLLASHARFQGLAGQVAAAYDAEGAIRQVEFLTRAGWRCRNQDREIVFFDCINEKTLERTEAWMHIDD